MRPLWIGMPSKSWRSIAFLTWVGVCGMTGTWLVAPDKVSAQGNKRVNQLIARLEEGKPVIRNGVDLQFVEMEHQPYLLDRLEKTLADLAEKGGGVPTLTPIVRIPLEGNEDSHWAVKQVLDSGAFGIIFPHIETREQATRVIRSMRYPPQRGTRYPNPPGNRGWGPTRAARYWGLSPEEYTRRADVWPLNPEGELFAMMLIETAEGIKNINEIVQVPGIGAIFIGPADLGVSLGFGPPSPNSYVPEVEPYIQTVLKACLAKNVPCAITVRGGEGMVKKRISEGFRMIMSGPGGGG